MSTGDGIPYKSQNPIQVHSNENFNLKFCENEQNLVVYWNGKENPSQGGKSNVLACKLEGYSLDGLVFTGSEFDNVVLVAGENIDTTSQEFLIVLYKIISRARKTVTVFSHPSNFKKFKSLLTLSDTDVYFDKQRYNNNFSSIAPSKLSSLKEEDIKGLECSETGRSLVAMMVVEENPQSSYNKAFLQYSKVDEKMCNPAMHVSADCLSSFIKDCNLHPHWTRVLLDTSPLWIHWKDKSEVFDLCCKLVDAELSTAAELMKSVFRENESFDNELPFSVDDQFLLDSLSYCVFRVIKSAKDTMGPFFLKSIAANCLLNAEEFWQFLKKQAITLEDVLTKFNGYFLLFSFASYKLNPDQFTEFLTSIGVDSLKLSDEQFLDDNRNNILMHCVNKITHFCIVADWALKQNDLEDLLSQRNCDGETCFILACAFDNFELVKILLQKYHYDWLRDGFNALQALCKNGNILIFKHLLSTLKGENVKMKLDSMRRSSGKNILMTITQNTKIMETFLKFLMEEKLFQIMLYEKDVWVRSCLFWAAAFQNIESIKMLTESYKYNWKTDRNIQGRTIAHILCASKRLDVLTFLSQIMAANLQKLLKNWIMQVALVWKLRAVLVAPLKLSRWFSTA